MAADNAIHDGEDGDGEEDIARSPVNSPLASDLDALTASGKPVPLPPEAAEYYREQTRFTRVQSEHLHEQRELIMAHLRMRRMTERFKSASQVALTLVSVVTAGFVGVTIYDAFTSRAIIVDVFDAPPSLAEAGITGKVVAGALLDVLTKVNVQAQTHAESATLGNGWTSEDIKVALPTNSISLNEINRMLRARFGHDVHISGDVIKSSNAGLALTIRGDGIVPRTFAGGLDDLSKLVVKAGEYIYGQSHPKLFASYLDTLGRYDEELAFCQEMFPAAARDAKPYLLNAWGNAITNGGGSADEALGLYRAASKLKPDYWTARNNIMNTLWELGNEEGAWHEGNSMKIAAGGRPGRASEFSYANWDALTWNLNAWKASTIGDTDTRVYSGTEPVAAGPAIADIDWRLHDFTDAKLRLQTMSASPDVPDTGLAHFVRGEISAATGDQARALAELEAFGAMWANPAISSNYPGYNCWIAPAEEAAGHMDKADAILKQGGHFVDCYRFRADILDHRGNWPAAQQAYQTAVELAPDLPAAYFSWGLALARHGDLSGAEEKFADSNKRGPHWADPIKAWGDILVKQNNWRSALAKYSEALQYAPDWNDLKEARYMALQHTKAGN